MPSVNDKRFWFFFFFFGHNASTLHNLNNAVFRFVTGIDLDMRFAAQCSVWHDGWRGQVFVNQLSLLLVFRYFLRQH